MQKEGDILMRYFLNYDKGTGIILGSYCDTVHGREIPVHNTVPAVGTVQTGVTIDLSSIPIPYIEIDEVEHDDWMQHQAIRKIDVSTRQLIEYAPPEPAPQIVTPPVDQTTADMWEAILDISAKIKALEGGATNG